MKSGKSKSQVPSSKKAPSGKFQSRSSVSYLELAPAVGTTELKDEPVASSGNGHPYDLEERTALFGEEIVRFAKTIPRDPGNDRLINQVVGAGTSVGANYCEASESVSKKDFLNIIGRCAKEAKETRFFLRMIAAAEPPLVVKARKLYREANELLLIFSSMRRKKMKRQISNSKLQASMNGQLPVPGGGEAFTAVGCLRFERWNFLEAWNLDFGISP